MYAYIYIYMYIHITIHIYIYIERERCILRTCSQRARSAGQPQLSLAARWTSEEGGQLMEREKKQRKTHNIYNIIKNIVNKKQRMTNT